MVNITNRRSKRPANVRNLESNDSYKTTETNVTITTVSHHSKSPLLLQL